jgi:hypothetical protein
MFTNNNYNDSEQIEKKILMKYIRILILNNEREKNQVHHAILW